MLVCNQKHLLLKEYLICCYLKTLKNSKNSYAVYSVDISISVVLNSYKFELPCSVHKFCDNRWRLMSRSTVSMEKSNSVDISKSVLLKSSKFEEGCAIHTTM